jgi:hypothetical protein
MTHQIGTAPTPSYVDKRRSYKDELESRIVTGPVMFTANATGTTTTIVGANATPSTNTNNIRIGDQFKLFNVTTGTLKQETVFRVTAVAVAGSTTVTFTPAATVAPISGDTCRLVDSDALSSTGNKDRRLVALGVSAARVATLTENDKDMQLRIFDDAGSL